MSYELQSIDEHQLIHYIIEPYLLVVMGKFSTTTDEFV